MSNIYSNISIYGASGFAPAFSIYNAESPTNPVFKYDVINKIAYVAPGDNYYLCRVGFGGSMYNFTATASGGSGSTLYTTNGVVDTTNVFKLAGDKYQGVFTGVFTGAESNSVYRQLMLRFGGAGPDVLAQTATYSGMMPLNTDVINWKIQYTIMLLDKTTIGPTSSNIGLEMSYHVYNENTNDHFTEVYYRESGLLIDITANNYIELYANSSGPSVTYDDILAKFGTIEFMPIKQGGS